MPNRVRVLAVPDADRAELERRARSKGAPARVVERARIVLLAADGLTGAQIAGRAGCTEPTVIKWRRQYAEAGLAGLEDAPRPGGPKTVLTDEVVCQILAATVTPPPESLRAAGVTHWSSRRLAAWLHSKGISVSHDSITVVWRKFCLAPHRSEGFKFSTDPQLEAKVRDVAGLYLAPPQNAVVVCVDENRRSRPWNGLSPSCRCGQASPSGTPTTTSATAPSPCSPPWTWPPARSPTPATAATATASSCGS
jgi:transposase